MADATSAPAQDFIPENSAPASFPDQPVSNSEILAILEQMQGQNTTILQHTITLNSAMKNLASGKSNTSADSKEVPRAMSSVLQRLFSDLLGPVNQLDELLDIDDGFELEAGDTAWLDSVRMVRGGFEKALAQWGCTVMPLEAGKDLFDATCHEALGRERKQGVPAGTVVQVCRRGWKLMDVVLQCPQVMVSA